MFSFPQNSDLPRFLIVRAVGGMRRVQISCDIRSRFARYLYSTKQCWIIIIVRKTSRLWHTQVCPRARNPVRQSHGNVPRQVGAWCWCRSRNCRWRFNHILGGWRSRWGGLLSQQPWQERTSRLLRRLILLKCFKEENAPGKRLILLAFRRQCEDPSTTMAPVSLKRTTSSHFCK